MHYIKSALKKIRFLHFNELNRDEWVIHSARKIKSGSKVLDLGAGSCPYRKYFDHCEYHTQDFTKLNSDQLRDSGYGQIDYVCDASSIPVENGTFDVVLSTEMLEHVPEPIEVLREISRILKPGGKLLLTAPLGSGIHQEPHHYYGGYTPYFFEKNLKEFRFTTVKIIPNKGFFGFYSQESLRFIRLSIESGNIWWKLLLPFRITAIFAASFILLSSWLFSYFKEDYRFTVGYFVDAIKGE